MLLCGSPSAVAFLLRLLKRKPDAASDKDAVLLLERRRLLVLCALDARLIGLARSFAVLITEPNVKLVALADLLGACGEIWLDDELL